MHHYKYIVIAQADIHKVDFKDVVEKSINHVRWNKDRTKFLLKFTDKCPKWYVKSPIYTKDQMLLKIRKNLW